MKFLLLLLSFPLFASELTVRDGQKFYALSLGPGEVRLKAEQVDLSVLSRDCSKEAVERFKGRVNLALKRATRLARSAPRTLAVSMEGKDFFVSAHSPSGKYLAVVPDEMKRLKFEELASCPK